MLMGMMGRLQRLHRLSLCSAGPGWLAAGSFRGIGKHMRPVAIERTRSVNETLRNALLALTLLLSMLPAACAWELATIREQIVTAYAPANNGAGPMWCYGSPLVVRRDDDVYISIIETGENVPPLCNTRWQLWRREGGAFRIVAHPGEFRQREPCPIATTGLNGPIFLSANPSTQPPGTQYGLCRPTVWRIDDSEGAVSKSAEDPNWAPGTYFTDHSYRGFAADVARGELLLVNIHARTSAQFVSHRTSDGQWHARGKIEFPIRAAYPQLALRDGAAHVLAIGDIVEPNPQWRELKRKHLKREWDYVFRLKSTAWRRRPGILQTSICMLTMTALRTCCTSSSRTCTRSFVTSTFRGSR